MAEVKVCRLQLVIARFEVSIDWHPAITASALGLFSGEFDDLSAAVAVGRLGRDEGRKPDSGTGKNRMLLHAVKQFRA